MTKQLLSAIVVAAFMASAAAVATVMTPTQKIVDQLPKLDLETAIPERFGDWQMDKRAVGGVVNPQQAEVLNQIYTQILTRTYVGSDGYRIMLSIAYGEDQRDSNQLHYPEVCYPAQGFQVTSNRRGVLQTAQGDIPVKRLESQMAQQRFEPITYWTTVGEHAVTGGVRKKLAEMEYGLKGRIPDGLLFRVSSIDRDSDGAFKKQEKFIAELLASLDVASKRRIAGL
ncbi:MAG: EpsI family protein [Gammaproteobacteria bacterium]|jgi:EpsI family protein|nr:EpsI family protein [Gammaproteobacteria bacterium]MBU0773321.1 EpsI family protein [Gammaproteobacteria bacterium]MBU0854713.1 EpsI family protein [Gammaproteobacteria bacterium]MBU1846711.1 EpsI family protein [Gammaproteobacteria bacterium]